MREFLAAGLVDHLHVVQVPILLGRGVRLWDGLEGLEQQYDGGGGVVAQRRHAPDVHAVRSSSSQGRITRQRSCPFGMAVSSSMYS